MTEVKEMKDIVMKDMYEYGMHTNFDTLKEDMSIAKMRNLDGEFRDRACFAPLRDMLKGGYEDEYDEPRNEPVRYVRFYPWIGKKVRDVPGYMEAVNLYLEVLLSIPFVKERIIEATGYSDGHNKSQLNTEKYYLVDMKVPVDEGFSILQMLRVPQEFPGQIKTFHDTMKATGCERTAFLASLLFMNSKGRTLTGGHHPTNGMSIKWAAEFIKDPGYARSLENKWNSNVMGGGTYCNVYYDDFVASLSGGDPCIIPVAVYGSLRKGLGNHALLSRAIEDKAARKMGMVRQAVPCTMYSLGAFPALHPSPEPKMITFELFHVNKKTLQSLDALEGYPDFYDRTQIILDAEPYWVYFHHNKPSDEVVTTGDWVEYINGKRKVHIAGHKEIFA